MIVTTVETQASMTMRGWRRGASDLREQWSRAPRVIQAFVIAVMGITLFPPATNFSPGMLGYVWILVVLGVLLTVLVAESRKTSLLTRWETWTVLSLACWMVLALPWGTDSLLLVLAATTMTLLAFACPWALMSRLSPGEGVQATLWSCGAAVLGSTGAAALAAATQGASAVLRPGLPIGGASNNGLALAVLLAGCLVGCRYFPHQRAIWMALAGLATILLLQSLSRAGYVFGGVVLLTAARLYLAWGWRLIRTAAGVLIIVGALGLVVLRGSAGFVDDSRYANAERGLVAWSDSAWSVLFGQGAMSVWPWLESERRWDERGVLGSMLQDGPWGRTLYHAHSTYLSFLAEYGVVGLGLLAALLIIVVLRCRTEIKRRGPLTLVAVAVLLALPAMLVELYLVRGFPSALLWWTAALAVGTGRPLSARRPGPHETPVRPSESDTAAS